METFKNILVVSRSTYGCVKALSKGISLARKFGSKLHVLHVIYDPFYFNGWNIPIEHFNKEFKDVVAKARAELDQLIAREKAEGMEIVEWVEYGKPVDEIEKLVEREHIGLVIMMAHEEGRLEHFLFGRTNETIVRRLPATLMLVKRGDTK
jgi:nucleotide-binding universal stress UspA family protein